MLESRAILVSLTISTWAATAGDKTASTKAADDAGAERESVRARKLLVPKAAIDPITKAVGILRKSIYSTTAPWSDNGWRLLPTDNWQRFNDEYAIAKQGYADAVQTFLARYIQDVREAHGRLGTLFNPSDYPSLSQLARKFSCSLDYSPVPNAGHIAVDLGAEDNARVRDSVASATKAKFETALHAAASEMRDHILTLKGALDTPNGKVFSSVVDNATRTARLLMSLNVYDNPEVAATCRSLLTVLDGQDVESLRKNAGYRAQVADHMGRVAHGLDVLFPGGLFQ